jgi:hypothetical protein
LFVLTPAAFISPGAALFQLLGARSLGSDAFASGSRSCFAIRLLWSDLSLWLPLVPLELLPFIRLPRSVVRSLLSHDSFIDRPLLTLLPFQFTLLKPDVGEGLVHTVPGHKAVSDLGMFDPGIAGERSLSCVPRIQEERTTITSFPPFRQTLIALDPLDHRTMRFHPHIRVDEIEPIPPAVKVSDHPIVDHV